MSLKLIMLKIPFLLLLTFHIILLKRQKKTFYEILEVKRNATKKQIRKNYKILVKKYHPDSNKKRANWAKKNFIEV